MKTIILLLLLCSVCRSFTADQVRDKIIASANKHGIDPDIAVAIGKTESNLKWNAVGLHGEVGPLQRLFPDGSGNVKDLDRNIESGILYLKEAKNKCSFYPDNAWVVCYNLGVYYKKLKHPKKFKYYVKFNQNLKKIKTMNLVAQQ